MTTINNIEDLIKLLDENPQWVEVLRARLLTRELMELPEKFAQFATVTNQRLDNLEGDVKEIKSDVRQLKSDVQGIRNDIGTLKGAHARTSARREAAPMAWELGFAYVRTLRSGDLLHLSQEGDSAAIPHNQLRSFHRADLVMEATDQAGESCYLAVEVSYTVDGRDTERAIRNAGFLTRFTGLPAYAVVAGLRYDYRVWPNIESSEVLWYEMDTDDLEPE